MRERCLLTLLVAVFASTFVTPASAEGPPPRPDTRPVMFVGNNWDGTADIIDVHTYQRLGRINTIPDKEERLAEIRSSPDKLAFFLAIRQFVGEGHDQYTGGGLPVGPHGDLARRQVAARIRFDREQGAPARRRYGPQDRRVPLGRLAAREQLLE